MKTSTLAAVIGNVVSLLAVWLINFGIELTLQQQADIVSALLVIVNLCALIIPAVLARQAKKRGSADPQSGFASPRLLVMLAVVSLLAITLGGCSLQPQTAREALALGYTAHTATTRTVTAATTSESITVDQAQQARASLVLARQQLEIAQSLVTADKPAADPLWRANSALQIVEQILTEAERHAHQ